MVAVAAEPIGSTELQKKILGESPSKEEILERVEEEGVEFINLQFTDVMGIVKSVTIPAGDLRARHRRRAVDRRLLDRRFTRIAESDMFLMPDLSTFAVIPWEQGELTTARVICWVLQSRTATPSPAIRAACSTPARAAGQARLHLQDRPGAGVLPLREGSATRSRRCRTTAAATSTSPPTSPAPSARTWSSRSRRWASTSRPATTRSRSASTRSTSSTATPSPTADRAVDLQVRPEGDRPEARPARHLHAEADRGHQRLRHARPPEPRLHRQEGQNAFVDENDPYGLSQTAKHFIAGQLAHARGMCGVIAPLVNSYRRLVPGFEAPVYVSWARTNRSALIRVPAIRGGHTAATRIELRCPDPSCNPYLAFAVMLAAGMDGIERELPLPEPVEENLYHFTDEDLKRRNIPTLPVDPGRGGGRDEGAT